MYIDHIEIENFRCRPHRAVMDIGGSCHWAYSPIYHIPGFQPALVAGPQACHVIGRAEGPAVQPIHHIRAL